MRLMVSFQGENLGQKTPLRGTAQMRLENGLIRYTFTSISFFFRNKYFVLSYVSKNELSRDIAPNAFCEWLKIAAKTPASILHVVCTLSQSQNPLLVVATFQGLFFFISRSQFVEWIGRAVTTHFTIGLLQRYFLSVVVARKPGLIIFFCFFQAETKRSIDLSKMVSVVHSLGSPAKLRTKL